MKRKRTPHFAIEHDNLASLYTFWWHISTVYCEEIASFCVFLNTNLIIVTHCVIYISLLLEEEEEGPRFRNNLFQTCWWNKSINITYHIFWTKMSKKQWKYVGIIYLHNPWRHHPLYKHHGIRVYPIFNTWVKLKLITHGL